MVLGSYGFPRPAASSFFLDFRSSYNPYRTRMMKATVIPPNATRRLVFTRSPLYEEQGRQKERSSQEDEKKHGSQADAALGREHGVERGERENQGADLPHRVLDAIDRATCRNGF